MGVQEKIKLVCSASPFLCYVHHNWCCNSGYTCCNKVLEGAMKNAMKGKDLLNVADSIQKSAEKSLGGKFETVVALDDFAYKSHFKVPFFILREF